MVKFHAPKCYALQMQMMIWSNPQVKYRETEGIKMANYRYDFESEYVKVGHLKEFQMTRVIMLEQIADYTTPFGLKLADNRIWIVSPSVDKLVKVAIEGSTLAYTDAPYANSNLMQNANLQKSWQAAVATGAVGATIEL